MRIMLIILSTALTAMYLSSCNDTHGVIYYIDSGLGNDNHPGSSPEKAWASLQRLNQTEFQPGDKILFRAGTEYFGQFKPGGFGSQEHPVMVDRYGEGDKPAIHGQGKYTSTLFLYNVEYWEINNLEITNKGENREAGRRGVIIKAEDYGDCHHIHLKNLVIHDVNGSLIKSEGGGGAIFWKNGGDSIKTRFIDLLIEDCYMYRCERNGINSRGYTSRDQWHPSLQVVIRNNLLEEIPGDGIVPIGCDGAMIEHNIMRNCPDILPHREAAAGIWPWSSDNTIIQYNEVSGHNAKWDGQGFDSDWNCQNTIIQYNYSHDNAGGFLLVCNNGNNIGTPRNVGTTGTIVRYNVSVNDGIRSYSTNRRGYFSPTMHISGPCYDTKIYNNVIFIPSKSKDEIDHTVIEMDNWGGPWPDTTLIVNNIFYSEDPLDFFWGESKNNTVTHNLFHGSFNNIPDEVRNIFKAPDWADSGMIKPGLESLEGFKLNPGSPCIKMGLKVAQGPVTDLFGNSLVESRSPSIGVHEFNDK